MPKEPLITVSSRGKTYGKIITGNALIVIGSRKDRGGMSKIFRIERQ